MKARHFRLHLIFSVLFVSTPAFPECVEYAIVDRGDSIEAVCVGTPLTAEEQRLKTEEEKREQQRAINQMRIDKSRESARLAEEQRDQEKRLKEQKAQEQKNAELNRPPQKSSDKAGSRLERARQQTIR